jgi:hypothetical protein
MNPAQDAGLLAPRCLSVTADLAERPARNEFLGIACVHQERTAKE